MTPEPAFQHERLASSGRVLYVEDDPVSANLLRAIIDALFPKVELLHASTGCAGIALARLERPDLVLLDMLLPDISGLDVVRELNPEISSGRLVVVLLTGAQASPATVKALALGAVACWAKPIDLTILRAGFERYLPVRASAA